MKRILILMVIVVTALITFGCQGAKTSPIDNIGDKEEIDFKIEQIVLSKSFQVTEPSVEIMTKKNTIKILASLGLTESSGVQINKLVREFNEINIHVTSIYEDHSLQLAVPQVILELNKADFNRVEDLTFNIINDDYRPLKIKLGINEALSKIQSHFKISANGAPVINLTRLKDDIFWDISYKSIFDRDSSKTPLVNVSATINANTGDILESKKTFISSSIDDGHILDYIPQKHILYKRLIKKSNDEDLEEQLWSYDLVKKEKSMLFSSNFKINSGRYSNDLSYVSIIESSDNGTGLYIIPTLDKKAYKISFEENFNPNIMSWQDDNTLYLVDNIDDKALIFTHNVEENLSSRLVRLNKHIENLVIKDNMFLIVETSEDDQNKKLSSTFDWKDFNFIANGFNPVFIEDDILAYLHNDESVDLNSLTLYSLKNNKILNTIDQNISAFQVLGKESIAYIKKNPTHNNFTLAKYYLEDESSIDIAPLVSDKVYYDEENKVLYVNISLPFENDKPEMIYSISLSNLN